VGIEASPPPLGVPEALTRSAWLVRLLRRMAATTNEQLVDLAGPIFERRDAGQDLLLFCRGLLVASFRRGDSIGRDVAIATLIRVGHGLKTDTIAELCDASHGWVCHVRQRLAEGGMDRVVERARRGPERKLVGAKEERLREMHADGGSVREIAKALGISKSVTGREIKRLKLPPRGWRMKQQALSIVAAGAAVAARKTVDPEEVQADDKPSTEAPSSAPEVSGTRSPEIDLATEATIDVVDAVIEAFENSDEAPSAQAELVAGAPLASGPAEHPCRYAGTLLLCAAAAVLGVFSALDAAHVARPVDAVYDAHQVFSALLAAWGTGYGSLEAMHERDARAMGVILGLERSPSVRTLHRAIAQMSARGDAIELNAALMQGVLSARLPERLCFGLDGHFKAYAGDEPIDKGWDSKRRLASKGIADVVVTDSHGFTWSMHPVAAGSGLGQHLEDVARTLRGVLGSERPIVVAFDRGGFDFDVLGALDRDGFHYVGYVPASVTLPDLGAIAPADDGVGEIAWSHGRLHHRARLIAERDGTSLIPVATNLPTLIDTATVMEQLRVHRGAQENSFKAARSFAHIDRLVDRGGASRAPDDRLVPNPARAALKSEQHQLAARIAELAEETPTSSGRSRKDINHDRFWAEVDSRHVGSKLRTAPAKVPRVTIEPDAQRAQLKTRHRLLLQPLKFAADNARRWLLGTLGTGLAPSDKPYDLETNARTLLALLHAPGTVRFEDEEVTVMLELPLPPTPHARLAAALVALDAHALLFADGRRRVRFRLAPRPTRTDIPGHHPGTR
jgi:transposase